VRKMQGEEKDCRPSQTNGRVLARALAEDLRDACGGLRATTNVVTSTLTDLGNMLDATYKGSDGDSV